MRYVDEFRNPRDILKVAAKIEGIAPRRKINIMEVCGTHTQNFHRFGLNKLLPKSINFISGPGCPVCVSPQGYIDAAIALSRRKDVIIITFGDMLRVPGTGSCLEKERAKGARVRIVYSPLESLNLARDNPDKKLVFLAVGFETTAPAIALSIIAAKDTGVRNLYFLTSLKLVLPVMRHLLSDKKLNVDAFLSPGHVSAIIGTEGYGFVAEKYKAPCCIAGFEPLDIMEGIYLILRQLKDNKTKVDNQYARVVAKRGNLKAQKIIRRVFKNSNAIWRGFGRIPLSGLKIRDEFSGFDAKRVFNLKTAGKDAPSKCRCAQILKGLIRAQDCPLFLKSCTPDNPVGPCMVSSEGACNAHFKYR